MQSRPHHSCVEVKYLGDFGRAQLLPQSQLQEFSIGIGKGSERLGDAVEPFVISDHGQLRHMASEPSHDRKLSSLATAVIVQNVGCDRVQPRKRLGIAWNVVEPSPSDHKCFGAHIRGILGVRRTAQDIPEHRRRPPLVQLPELLFPLGFTVGHQNRARPPRQRCVHIPLCPATATPSPEITNFFQTRHHRPPGSVNCNEPPLDHSRPGSGSRRHQISARQLRSVAARRRRSTSRTARRLAAGITAILVLATSCADFSNEPVAFTDKPTLTAAEPTPIDPDRPSGPRASESESSPGSTPEPSGSEPPADPCKPSDAAIIAACLDTPWGLAVLPNGTSAVVGERKTGRLLVVSAPTPGSEQPDPVEIAKIPDLDSTGGGGLLGVALSPSYAEDGLIYLYVTTATDNRILRMAMDDKPKAIFTGIPKGDEHNGGRIAFGIDGFLYIATGDAGDPQTAADPKSLSGKILRIDEFGNPVGDDETDKAKQSPVFAFGLTDPTGLCLLPTGRIGVIEPAKAADVLIQVTSGADLQREDGLWSFPHADGGAVDCASDQAVITATSLDGKLATSLTLTETGAFKGQPEVLLEDEYGRLLTAATGSEGLTWMTTSNKDGKGEPTESDDLVIVVPNTSGEQGGGVD